MKDNEEFKKDFNKPQEEIKNEVLLKKYGFNSVKDMCEYARENNLIINKPLTEEEEKNLKEISKFLNKELREVLK